MALVIRFLAFWLIILLGVHAPAAEMSPIKKEPRYNNWPKIGSGTYGEVLQCGDSAVKITCLDDEDNSSRGIMELAIYRSFNSPFMPTVSHINIHRGRHNSFLEVYMPFYKPITADQVPSALEQVAAVLSLAHNNNVAHRDIKMAHLMTDGQSVVLIDWGMADIFTASPIKRCGTTLAYRAPEILLLDFSYPQKGDVWALAISLLEVSDGGKDIFPCSYSQDALNAIFRNPIPVAKPYQELVETLKNGQQQLSDRITQSIKKMTQPTCQHHLSSMLQPLLNDRATPEQLMGTIRAGNSAPKQTGIAPLAKPLFREGAEINARMRKITYVWLYDLMVEFHQADKILFEAMSIADVFIKTTDLTKSNLQMAAAIAFYLAEDFYEEGHTINSFVNYADNSFTKEQFKNLMLKLLENAQGRLIYKHSLRAYQEEIYQGTMSENGRRMVIFLLAMLEIDRDTYAKSLDEKWQTAMAIVNHINKEEPISPEHDALWQALCRRFSQESLAKQLVFSKLCPDKY